MDEIDAALDFKNVSIVANYIKVSGYMLYKCHTRDIRKLVIINIMKKSQNQGTNSNTNLDNKMQFCRIEIRFFFEGCESHLKYMPNN